MDKDDGFGTLGGSRRAGSDHARDGQGLAGGSQADGRDRGFDHSPWRDRIRPPEGAAERSGGCSQKTPDAPYSEDGGH